MPRGKPDDVRAEVRERINVLGRGGGYILASTHNFHMSVLFFQIPKPLRNANSKSISVFFS